MIRSGIGVKSMWVGSTWRRLWFAVAVVSLFTWLGPKAAGAAAEPPSFFTQFPEDAVPGSEAGRMSEPKAVGIDPVTHHVFIAEWQQGFVANNNRISEFTPWGEFVKAFGWGVRDGSAELQVCTEETGCQKGLEGSAAGQFERPNGLAFDAAGNLYVFERRNSRVQKFDPTVGPEGEDVEFVLQFGGAGSGEGQFFIENLFGVDGNYIAMDPSDAVTAGGTLYVADKGRIQAFDNEGNLEFQFPLPKDLNPGALAFDPASGDLYFAFNQEAPFFIARPEIYRFDPVSGEEVGDPLVPDVGGEEIKDAPVALAVDPVGNLYVVDDPPGAAPDTQPRVLKFDSAGNLLAEFDAIQPTEVENILSIQEPGLAAATVGKATDEIDVYVSHARSTPGVASVKVYGAVPDPDVVGPPPLVPPTIKEQYALSVNATEATVRAAINPHFWDDATYYVEYGTVDCATGPCGSYPAPPGSLLTTKVVGNAIDTAGVILDGLAPGTKYSYRFVSQSTGSGGEAVKGPTVSFTTPSLAPPPPPCPQNAAFRPGTAANLPDCRAYEMVSPVQKNGADIAVVFNATGYPAGFDQGASSGDAVSFAAYRSFGDAISAPYTSQYLASRSDSGWASNAINAPREGPSLLEGKNIDANYKALSPGLASGWLLHDTKPTLDPKAPPGYANLYRRDNATGAFEALIATKPPSTAAAKFRPEVQGHGGECTVFRANDKLTANALANGKYQLYEACEGQPLALVSVLPAGNPAAEASAGTGSGSVEVPDDRNNRVIGAVSADGQRVFWSDKESGLGKLHARLGGSQTIALSKGAAQFWAAAGDGSRAIFSEGETLYEFEVGKDAKEAGSPIAGEVAGIMGASADASVVYLVSREALDAGASAGELNLYLYEAGGFRFIATLAAADAGVGGGLGPLKSSPVFHAAQVTPDGGAVAFSSVAPLTGYDNTDAVSGKADSEVFVYRAGPDRLVCASCDPSGARPTGREVKITEVSAEAPQPTAAQLPTARSQLHSPRVISANGNRVYFNSYVPLISGDTNGKADVYQWEALGEGNCAVGALGYDAAFAGCVNLISAGKGPQDSTFVDASATGRDVFFKTGRSLLPQDPGLIDVYDAREGGGFPLQGPPPPECEGEACQSPAPAPSDPTPSSQAFQGPGNLRPPAKCPKGKRKAKRKGKQACVKKKTHKRKSAKHRRPANKRGKGRNKGKRAGKAGRGSR